MLIALQLQLVDQTNQFVAAMLQYCKCVVCLLFFELIDWSVTDRRP
jgi:hypothetical protein